MKKTFIEDKMIGSWLSQVKSTLVLALIIIAIIIAAVLFFKFSGINIPNPFKEQPIVIDKTVNVVEEINRIAELATTTYYEDYVIVKQKSTSVWGVKISLPGHIADDELVLITKGKVRAGFDLSKLQEQDVAVDSVSITLKLPKPQILDVISNPSDFETFEESGKWSHEEVTDYKNEARAAIEKDALESGILERAEESGKQKLTSFLQALGFQKVFIEQYK
jgi:hypothetical protein